MLHQTEFLIHYLLTGMSQFNSNINQNLARQAKNLSSTEKHEIFCIFNHVAVFFYEKFQMVCLIRLSRCYHLALNTLWTFWNNLITAVVKDDCYNKKPFSKHLNF